MAQQLVWTSSKAYRLLARIDILIIKTYRGQKQSVVWSGIMVAGRPAVLERRKGALAAPTSARKGGINRTFSRF
jgi:hypothetical protein